MDINISAAENSREAADIIVERLKKDYGDTFFENLYKIRLVGRNDFYSHIKVAEISAILSPLVYFIKFENQLKPNYDFEALKNDIGLKGIFVKKMLDKMADADQKDLALLENALFLGLEAFEGQVSYNED